MIDHRSPRTGLAGGEKRAGLLRELIQVNRAYQTAVEKMDEAFLRSSA